MQRDRDDYRSMSPKALTDLARDEGINPEMAIAMAEKLRRIISPYEDVRGFVFNRESV
jgi:hypothetical protein